MGAVPAEQHDEWTEMRRYIGLRTPRSPDMWSGMHPLGGPVKEESATLEGLGDDMPSYVVESENRGAGMIVTFTRGSGEAFNGGSTQ